MTLAYRLMHGFEVNKAPVKNSVCGAVTGLIPLYLKS
jgi:hypothetical protein